MIYEFVEWATSNIHEYVNVKNKIDIDKRMKQYIDKSNSIRYCNYKNPYVVTLKSKNILKYINHITNINEKLQVMSKLNEILQKLCKKMYNQFDIHIIYAFNNEINIIFRHKQKSDLLYAGDVIRILTTIASYATMYCTNIITEYELYMEPIFEAKYIEFDKEYELLNYIIWRQLDCKRNNLSLLYKCLWMETINEIDYDKKQDGEKIYNAKVEHIINALLEYNSDFMDKYSNLMYGNIIKKGLVYKETENVETNDLAIRKIVEIKCYDLIKQKHDEMLALFITNKYL
jgi:tRNA(His) 5'-end guanylyltransferase